MPDHCSHWNYATETLNMFNQLQFHFGPLSSQSFPSCSCQVHNFFGFSLCDCVVCNRKYFRLWSDFKGSTSLVKFLEKIAAVSCWNWRTGKITEPDSFNAFEWPSNCQSDSFFRWFNHSSSPLTMISRHIILIKMIVVLFCHSIIPEAKQTPCYLW